MIIDSKREMLVSLPMCSMKCNITLISLKICHDCSTLSEGLAMSRMILTDGPQHMEILLAEQQYSALSKHSRQHHKATRATGPQHN